MTTSSDASIGVDDANSKPQSGIADETPERRKQRDGGSGKPDAGRDLTREDIAAGNDRNVSADDGGRSGTTNKNPDDAIELGK